MQQSAFRCRRDRTISRRLSTPSNSLAGRRLTYRSSSCRSRSSSPPSRMPGSTRGSPTAPMRIAAWVLISASTPFGRTSPVRRYRSAPRSKCVIWRSKPSAAATTSRTRRASAVTSGPIPSPGTTAIVWLRNPLPLRLVPAVSGTCRRWAAHPTGAHPGLMSHPEKRLAALQAPLIGQLS